MRGTIGRRIDSGFQFSNYYWLLAISRNFRYNVPGSETGFQTDAENTTFYISPSV